MIMIIIIKLIDYQGCFGMYQKAMWSTSVAWKLATADVRNLGKENFF